MNEPLLRVDQLHVAREGVPILQGVSLQAQAGEITGVLGRNGAGKSTLAYALMGLPSYAPSKGIVRFSGEDISDWSITERARAGLTLAWQHPARYEGITVGDYLKLSSPGAAPKDLEEALDLVQLGGTYLARRVDKALSGGERKRIELASVYLMHPKLAILDEPESGVDLLALGDILSLFHRLAREGSGVLIITHREDVASQCHRSYLMCRGHIILEGSAEAVKRYFLSQCEPCGDNAPEASGEVAKRV